MSLQCGSSRAPGWGVCGSVCPSLLWGSDSTLFCFSVCNQVQQGRGGHWAQPLPALTAESPGFSWLCSAGAKEEYPWNGALSGFFQRGGKFESVFAAPAECWSWDPSKHWNSSFCLRGLDFESPVALKSIWGAAPAYGLSATWCL